MSYKRCYCILLNQRDQVSAQICSADTGVAGPQYGGKGEKGETESVAGGRRETAKGDAVASPFLRYLREVRLLLNFLYAGYANFYATVRSQAGDQLSLGLDAVTLGAGDRVGFAATFDGNLAGSHTFAD